MGPLAPAIDEESSKAPSALTQSAGAVLLVETAGRLFGLTFGTGRHAIPLTRTEYDFGLRVTANAIDPHRMNSAESRGFDKGRASSAIKLPVPNELFALGLSPSEDWVKRLGGKSLDVDFANSVAGADSLAVNVPNFNIFKLKPLLSRALELFLSEDYKTRFPFIDYFRRVPDKDPLVGELDGRIYDEMASGSLSIGFAAPDEFEVPSPDFFTLTRGRSSVELSELDTDEVYAALTDLEAWRNPLERVRITAFGGQGEFQAENAKLKKFVSATVDRPGEEPETYAVTGGSWFQVDPDYSSTVERFMRDVVADASDEFSFPLWDAQALADQYPHGYDELRYNRYLAQERDYALLDRDLYEGPIGQHVEVCDLLTPTKDLICVKRLDGASQMSHLFQQGSVSASLMKDHPYQEKVLSALGALKEAERVSYGSDHEWRFIFAIATHREGSIKDLLSFFSKVALRTHLERIDRLGFRVAVAKIPRVQPIRGPVSMQSTVDSDEA